MSFSLSFRKGVQRLPDGRNENLFCSYLSISTLRIERVQLLNRQDQPRAAHCGPAGRLDADYGHVRGEADHERG